MIGTLEPSVADPFDEVSTIVASTVDATVADALRRAHVCGCRGCKVQALEAWEWAQSMRDDGCSV